MIWGVLPGIFKAYFNTNETLFTLMLNYVAMQIVNFCIVYWENPVGSNTVGIINSATQKGWFPKIFGMNYGMNLIVVLVITVVVHIYMKYSKQGYEIAVVGESPATADVICGSFLFGGLYILYIYMPGLTRATKELCKMLPYVVTILALVITSKRNNLESQPPGSLGEPYFREERWG